MGYLVNPFINAPPISLQDEAIVNLAHFDGTNGQTTTGDSALGGVGAPHAMTMSGAALDTSQTAVLGSSSVRIEAGEYVTMPDSADWVLGNEFTIESYVMFNSIPVITSADYDYIWSQFEDGGAPELMYLALYDNGTNHTLEFTVQSSTGSIFLTLLEVWTPSLSTWYHIAVSRYFDTALGFYRWSLYIDGVEVDFSTEDAAYPDFNASWVLGGINGNQNIYTFDGWLDECRVSKGYAWHRGSAFEVPGIPYTAYKNDWFADCVCLLPFNGVDADTKMFDLSDTNALCQTNTGNAKVDTALFKFGVSSLECPDLAYAELPDNAAYDLGSDDFTIECWVRFSDIQSATENFVCGQYDDVTATDSAWRLYCNGTGVGTGDAVFTLYVGSTPYTVTIVGAFSNNTWYHVAATRNGADLNLWVNGVGSATTDVSTLSVNASTETLAFGANATVSGFMKGHVDDFRMIVGRAMYDATFTPPTKAFSRMYEE